MALRVAKPCRRITHAEPGGLILTDDAPVEDERPNPRASPAFTQNLPNPKRGRRPCYMAFWRIRILKQINQKLKLSAQPYSKIRIQKKFGLY